MLAAVIPHPLSGFPVNHLPFPCASSACIDWLGTLIGSVLVLASAFYIRGYFSVFTPASFMYLFSFFVLP